MDSSPAPARPPRIPAASYLRRALPDAGSATQSTISPLLAGLNPAQREAVSTPAEVVQILAPPGSGKTRTLTSRVAYLLTESPLQLEPENVIVATFTVKAANEMKERLAVLVGEETARRLVMGTFHSIARRYLLKYGNKIGLKNGWGIADTTDSKAICTRVINKHNLKDIVDAKKLVDRISYFKARNLTPVAAGDEPLYTQTHFQESQSSQSQRTVTNEEFIQLYDAYHDGLKAGNLLDYDDLLIKCLELLTDFPECVRNVDAVLIDEFQDTNVIQYELMRALSNARNRITIVGDPDQSIYAFRAAEIGNLAKMRQAYPSTFIVNLEDNYRSSASILQAALEIIKQNVERFEKPLQATHAIGPSPVLRRVPNAAAEGEWIANEIHRLKALTAQRITYGHVAVLVRSAFLTRNIENAFAKAGIPYRMSGGTRFFERPEIKVVVDYLRVLQNPMNVDAILRIVNVPSRKLGAITMQNLREAGDQRGLSLWDFMVSCAEGGSWPGFKLQTVQAAQLTKFVLLLKEYMGYLDEEGSEGKLADIIDGLLGKINYQGHLEKTYTQDYESRMANVTEAISQAQQTPVEDDDDVLPDIEGVEQMKPQKNARKTLDRFMANVALVNERKEEDDVEEDGKVNHGMVTISTMHAAKGLEWPVVFVPSVYEGSIPHSRSDDHDEERRLLYVAMTRAQALLYLSCPWQASFNSQVALSSFVTQQKVSRLLVKKAPELSFSNVQTVCQILGKPCPTELEIEAAIQASNIASRLDDQIDDRDPEEVEREKKEAEAKYQKARAAFGSRESSNQSSRSFSRSNSSTSAKGWTAQTTKIGGMTSEQRIAQQMTSVQKIGFQSASVHLSTLKEQGIASEAEKTAKEKRDRAAKERAIQEAAVRGKSNARAKAPASWTSALAAKPAPVPAPAGKRAKRATPTNAIGTPEGEKSIRTFFKQPPAPTASKSASTAKPAPRPLTATDAMRSITTSTTITSSVSLKTQMESLPAPRIPKRPSDNYIVFSSSPQNNSWVPGDDGKRRRSGGPGAGDAAAGGLSSSPFAMGTGVIGRAPPSSPLAKAAMNNAASTARTARANMAPPAQARRNLQKSPSFAEDLSDGENQEETVTLPVKKSTASGKKGFDTSAGSMEPTAEWKAERAKNATAAGGAGRGRTLGMRRSMKGWDARRKK